ncbi:MAG: tRNA 2-thiouridine(34) synthase MnmA [Clostridia bacterium]
MARGTKGRVMVAMSGGVDSSVAAALLLEEGYACIGVTMQLWPEDLPREHESGCCSISAVEDARRVANKLGIPYYVLNFADIFVEEVIDRFADEYLRGRTPNPCIVCNEKVKFGAFLEKALELECDYVATGHYAIVERDEASGRYLLKRARDRQKDQSYTLYGLTQEQLSRTLFPLGPYLKEETRRIARELGLITAAKPDSQEICFVPEGDYRAFMERYRPESKRPGPIVDLQGNVLGQHQGIAFYTVGQRKGLGIPHPTPLYVVAIDEVNNALVVGPREAVEGWSLLADPVNFIAVPQLDGARRVTCKIRYRVQDAPATIEPAPEGGVITRFDEPQAAITPGQSVVWYDGDVVVGGGIIQKDLKLDGISFPAPGAAAGQPLLSR